MEIPFSVIVAVRSDWICQWPRPDILPGQLSVTLDIVECELQLGPLRSAASFGSVLAAWRR